MNQIGDLGAGKLKSFQPDRIQRRRYATGRNREMGLGIPDQHDTLYGRTRGGESGVGGIYNTFYWIDPKRRFAP